MNAREMWGSLLCSKIREGGRTDFQSHLTELNYGMRSTDIDNFSLDC